MTAYQSTLDFLSTTGESIKQIFTELAVKLGEVVGHLYIVLVRQQMVIGLQNLILCLSFSVASFIIYRLYRSIKLNDRIHVEDKWLLLLILVLVGLFTISRAIVYLNISLPYLLNPEYYALLQAKDMLKEIR